jgi:ParB-like chromosome segregation protein Spo0J
MSIKSIIKDAGVTVAAEVFNVPLELLDTNPDNIRQTGERLSQHIRIIADDIAANGFDRGAVLTIRMINDRAQVQDGNCRLMAARLAASEGAEIKALPCVIEARRMSDADRVVRMATRNQGLPHSPEDYAIIITKLESYGWPRSQIAAGLGKSHTWIANTLALAEAAPDVKAAITAGTVSATEAIKQVRQHGAKAGAVIAEAAKASPTGKVTAKRLQASAPPLNAPHQPALAVNGDLVAAVTGFLRVWDYQRSQAEKLIEAVETMRFTLPVSE